MGNVYPDSCLNVIETRDFETIKTLLSNKHIYPGLVSIKYLAILEDAEKHLDHKSAIYYLLKYGEKDVGFCAILDFFDKFNQPGYYGVDIGILKEFRGKIGYQLARNAYEKFMKDYRPNKLFALVRKDNRPSFFFSKNIGFQIFNEDNDYYYLEAEYGWRS